jgi:hypothetical protein
MNAPHADPNGLIDVEWCARTKASHYAPLDACTGTTIKGATSESLIELRRPCPSCGKPIWQAVDYHVDQTALAAALAASDPTGRQ